MTGFPKHLNRLKAGTHITTPGGGVRVTVRMLLVLCICTAILSPVSVLANSPGMPDRPSRPDRPARSDYQPQIAVAVEQMRSNIDARINAIYERYDIPRPTTTIDTPSFPMGASAQLLSTARAIQPTTTTTVFTRAINETTHTVTASVPFVPVYTHGVAVTTWQSANRFSQPPAVSTVVKSKPTASNSAIAVATLKLAKALPENTAKPSQTTTIAAEYTPSALPVEETVTDTEFTPVKSLADTATPNVESTPTHSTTETVKAATPKKPAATYKSPTVRKASLLPRVVGWIPVALLALTVIAGMSARLIKLR